MRVDSVHQGDLDGRKGAYEINLVGEITQYEFVGAVEAISERFLIPVLEGEKFNSDADEYSEEPDKDMSSSWRCG